MSSESVVCNTSSADYFVSYVSEGLVTVVAVTGLRMQ